jgi:hypothetical protein
MKCMSLKGGGCRNRARYVVRVPGARAKHRGEWGRERRAACGTHVTLFVRYLLAQAWEVRFLKAEVFEL